MKHDEENVQCFMFTNFGVEIIVETMGKMTTCISCLEMFSRIDLHFKKCPRCTKHVEMETFWHAYKENKKEVIKMKN